jgi:hypothetical protein
MVVLVHATDSQLTFELRKTAYLEEGLKMRLYRQKKGEIAKTKVLPILSEQPLKLDIG